ncbi:MAG TPA: hypothetical protein VGM39_23100 [Kofleriaceae bacterium]
MAKKPSAKTKTKKKAASTKAAPRATSKTGDAAVIEGVIKHAWSDAMDLVPWRRDGGAIESAMLRVDFADGAEPAENTVVRVSVTNLRANPDAEQSFVWICDGKRPIKQVKDVDLGAIADERSKPRVYDNKILGPMTLDRMHGWYAVERASGGHTYEARITVPDPDDTQKSLKALTAGAGAILAAEAKMLAIIPRVVDKMLPLYLNVWRDGGKKYTAAELTKRLVLASVHAEGKKTTLRFEAGQLFGDKEIEVQMAGGKVRECFPA